MSFPCNVCGELHVPESLSFGADLPDPITSLPEAERRRRVVGDADQAILDRQYCFLRAVAVVPIRDHTTPMLLGLWATLHPEDYNIVVDTWNLEGREQQVPPIITRIVNTLACYPPLLNVTAEMRLQKIGTRPHLLVTDKNHPLYAHQREGITLPHAVDLASRLMHPLTPVADPA